MTTLLTRFCPKKKVLTPAEENANALREEFRRAMCAYHTAIDRYNMFAADDESEDILYKAMVIARDNVDNTVRLLKLNAVRSR